MKDKVKSVLGNGLPWGVVFFALSFGLSYFISQATLSDKLWMSAGIGICALLINGLIYRRFSKRIETLKEISVNLTDKELVLLEAPANHSIDDTLVPGKLFLTTERLLFTSYAEDDSKAQLCSWHTDELTPKSFHPSLWNAGGELLLVTKAGNTLMFEVDKLKVWKESLQDYVIGKR